MLILIAFQSSKFRYFKIFYQGLALSQWKTLIPDLPSYNRFIELIPRITMLLFFFSQVNCGKCNGVYYIDSSCLPVCHLKRSRRQKSLKEIGAYGRTSVGWFFGLTLHLFIH